MGRIVLASLLALPFAEIAVFILVGGQIGVLATLAAIILTAFLGIVLLRQQGLAVLMDSRAMMARGELPARQVAEAMMLALAGVLLLVPGFITDVAAFILLIAPLRHALYRWLSRSMVIVTSHGPADGPPPTIELDRDDYRGQ